MRRPYPSRFAVSDLLVALLLAAVATAGCGGGLRQQHTQRAAAADAHFMRACYTCLQKAFEGYEALRLAGYQPALMRAKAFDTAILLAMREKDLAMDAGGWLQKAAALAPTVDPARAPSATPPATASPARPATTSARPATASSTPPATSSGAASSAAARAALYLDMARHARWAAGKLDEDQAARFERETAAPAIAAMAEWETALGPPASRDLVGTYLMAAMACAYTPPTRQQARLTIEQLAPVHRGTPLMQYALGSCKPQFRDELEPLASDPDFHEAVFQNGRQRLFQGGPTVHLDAKVLFEAARDAMPEAVANLYLLAGVHRTLEEFPECAARYDDVVRLKGAARDAMLHRTECLTRGALREEAIASATTLIDSPGIHTGQAFYYRAWNRYHLKALEQARSDVDNAKRSWVSGDVFVLSGFIAYDQQQPDFAYTEFGEGLRLNPAYCIARFYQGLIDSTRDKWPEAADAYEKTTTCYGRSVGRLEADLKRAEALEADNPTRERQIENLTAGLEAEKLMLARAAYNTAYSFGRAGQEAKGVPFAMQAAAAHKEMQKLAEELLAILRKGGQT